MTGAGQSVAAHAAVVFFLVGSLPATGQTHYHVARTDVCVVYHIGPLHAAGHCAIYDDGAHQVAHIGSLTAGAIDSDAHLTHLLHQFVRAVDDGAYHFTGDKHLVASDGTAHKDVIHSTHAQQVIGVHDECILRYTLPHRQVACLAPVGIGQTALGTCAVGMHDAAVLWVASQYIGDYLAESLREHSLVDVLDCVVHIFLSRAHSAHHVTLVAHRSFC